MGRRWFNKWVDGSPTENQLKKFTIDELMAIAKCFRPTRPGLSLKNLLIDYVQKVYKIRV